MNDDFKIVFIKLPAYFMKISQAIWEIKVYATSTYY